MIGYRYGRIEAMRRYQARIQLDDDREFIEYARVFGRALRSLYAQRRAEKAVTKPTFMQQHGLTARQYNAVIFSLDGMEESIREFRPMQIADGEERLKAISKKLVKTTGPQQRHNLKRRIARLEAKRKALMAKREPRICFGSRKLFNAQHHLPANGCTSFAEWQTIWRARRDAQFFVLGSKDESGGCQGCVMTHLGGERFVLRLRLPKTSNEKSVSFEVAFRYGAQHLSAALHSGQAISYRFLKDGKGWRVFVSTKALVKPAVSRLATGCIGIDLNVGHVAVSETDRSGNLIAFERLPLHLYGRSSAQSETAIAECVKRIIAHAVRSGKPLSLENLNFAKKKAQLSYAKPKTQRMLSAFTYHKFEQMVLARAHDAGIQVIPVHPAYSSKIGRQKYARRYGLSGHLAAALVLARRGQKFRDRYVSSGTRHRDTTREDRAQHGRTIAKETELPGRAEVVPRARSAQADLAGVVIPGGVRAKPKINPCDLGEIPRSESSPARVRATSADHYSFVE